MPTQFPRSPYDAVKGLAYFPRMLDKIRINAAGRLPEPIRLPISAAASTDVVSTSLQIKYDDL